MDIGERIRELRELKGFKPRELAQRAHVSPEYIYKVERGEIKSLGIQKLESLAKALGEPIWSLTGHAEGAKPKNAVEAPAYIPRGIPVMGKVRAGRGLYYFFDDEGQPILEHFRRLHQPEYIKD